MDEPVILGVNSSHNASATLTIGNEIVYHLEAERITNDKYSHFPHEAIRLVKDYVDHIDAIALAGVKPTKNWYSGGEKTSQYLELVRSLGKSFTRNKIKVFDYGRRHHLCHAAAAFYNSGFDDALCIIKDGAGSDVGRFREQESNFIFSYDGDPELIDRITSSNGVGIAESFEIVSMELGFTEHDAGKVMGLAPYYLNKDKLDESMVSMSSLAYHVQSMAENSVIEDVLRLIDKTKKKNICFSGGLFLNCVMNYKIIKSIPDDINVYVEPISNDSGTSIGAARLAYYHEFGGNKRIKQESIFYGPKRKIGLGNEHVQMSATNKDVSALMANGSIVAVFQGGSEAGPRALGNRSILYDPRDASGKDIVNKVKKREWFRPFAGSVLSDHSDQWFDMHNLDESPFMMFAVNVLDEKRSIIPSITHVDGTCRVQTVDKKDNQIFYNLIEEFYKITGVPILFNTSFNLAGDCLVETVDDALKTFYSSDIDVLYFPEVEKIIVKDRTR